MIAKTTIGNMCNCDNHCPYVCAEIYICCHRIV